MGWCDGRHNIEEGPLNGVRACPGVRLGACHLLYWLKGLHLRGVCHSQAMRSGFIYCTLGPLFERDGIAHTPRTLSGVSRTTGDVDHGMAGNELGGAYHPNSLSAPLISGPVLHSIYVPDVRAKK